MKKNEPGCYGIGSDRIGDFNEQVTKIEVYDVKTQKKIAETDIPENRANQNQLCNKDG